MGVICQAFCLFIFYLFFYLSSCRFPYVSITSPLWTVYPCSYLETVTTKIVETNTNTTNKKLEIVATIVVLEMNKKNL